PPTTHTTTPSTRH
ncbi:Short-chain dehydrogenase/reductase ATR7, partial [Fusarium oxysporum f. sp. albedinis]